MTKVFFIIINGGWFALNLCLLMVFARYLVVEGRRRGTDSERVWAAAWIAMYFVGETGWRGLVWWHRGDAQDVFESSSYLMLIGFGMMATAGALGCVASFAPEKCGWRSIMAAMAIAATFAALSYYLA